MLANFRVKGDASSTLLELFAVIVSGRRRPTILRSYEIHSQLKLINHNHNPNGIVVIDDGRARIECILGRS